MLGLRPSATGPLRVALLGAHCDDAEIGCGGALLDLAGRGLLARADVLVAASTPERELESRACLAALCDPAPVEVRFGALPDGRLPGRWDEVKALLQEFASAAAEADLVFAPSPSDAHQDHRLLGELVRSAFRDHLVLHYEVPKWDGDLGASRPAVHWPLTAAQVRRKWTLLHEHHASQRPHDWFREEVVTALAVLRGVECREEAAEAFAAPALALDLGPPARPDPPDLPGRGAQTCRVLPSESTTASGSSNQWPSVPR